MSNAGEIMTNEEAVDILLKMMQGYASFSQRLAIGKAIHALKEQQALRKENQRLKEAQFQYGRF